MRRTALLLALATGCGTTSYKIPGTELQRLATIPPAQRGQSVRVIQQLSDADVGPPAPITGETQIVIFPDVVVYDGGRRRARGGGGGWGPHANVGGNASGGTSVHSTGGGGGHSWGGAGGDGKAEAIAILVIAATALVAVAAVEGSRDDGYVQLHPMHPLYLFGQDGSRAVMPLAALDPDSAAFSEYAIVRSTEGPWHWLGRAALDRAGWTYAMFGGIGTYQSADGTTSTGTATTIQLGYFPEQHFGVVANWFFGWRDNNELQTLFENRYTLELQGYLAQAGALHFGLYGGGGGATRLEDGVVGGNASSLALQGGALIQLDFNTRLALTARIGQTYAHDERMSEAMLGLSVY
ncbi:MAG: hypothetical protein ABI467_08770 [Kofleriaceae bacterium]